MNKYVFRSLLVIALAIPSFPISADTEIAALDKATMQNHLYHEDLSLIVVIKSSNYSQAADGALKLLNYHFFAEVFPKTGGTIQSASILRQGGGMPAEFVPHHSGHPDGNSPFYFEGGHFSSLEEVDRAFPNGDFIINVKSPGGDIVDHVMTLMGDSGKTEIPAPITITLIQEGRQMDVNRIDPEKDLTVRWSEYTGARRDPNNIVHDMIFVVVANCYGTRIVHTGLPFIEPNYLTFDATEYQIPAGTLRSGQPHSMYVEFPRAIDTAVVEGVPTFTSYETATYMDLHTLGEPSGPQCPERLPPLDTGQTDR
jgi:hypothetical protein